MALTTTPALILKGAIADFQEKIQTAPQIWRDHAMEVPSTSAKETYAFVGSVPTPRVFVNARSIQGFQDFNFDIENQTYELTMLIDLEDFEDDQIGGITMRFSELAEVFATYKDQLFATLLENGDSTTDGIPPLNSAAGAAFLAMYDDTSSIGASGTIDNLLADSVVANSAPTPAELHTMFAEIRSTMLLYNDDQGRAGFNAVAGTKLRFVIPPQYEMYFAAALNSLFHVGNAAGGSQDNVFRGFGEYDVLPYLSSGTVFWANFVGATRKPFIFQNRLPLQITVDTSPEGMQERNGVLVMCRERFALTYGEPRRSTQMTVSTT